jgi:hypothetical protein
VIARSSERSVDWAAISMTDTASPGGTRRRFRAAASSAGVIALLAASINGQLGLWPSPVTAGGPTFGVSPTVGEPGDLLAASGSGFLPGLVVSVTWDGDEVITDQVASDGTFDVRFRIPADAEAGIHEAEACYADPLPDPCPNPVRVTVTLPATPPPATPPPATPPPATPTPPTPPPQSQPPLVAATPAPTPTPAPTVPVPSFPIAVPTPVPTPTPPVFVAVTPKPTPPDGLVPPESEFTDLWIKDIEVTQGIQNVLNSMPLVEDRRTYARVYVGTFGADTWPHTYGALEARRNGNQIGWVWPENGPITAKLGAGNRVELDDSLQFRLPQSWLSGDVTLTAFVYSYTVSTPFTEEPEWTNNLASVDVEFHPADPLTVHLAPLHIHRSYHPSDVERIYASDLTGGLVSNAGSGTMRIVNGLYRFHPLAQVNLDLLEYPIEPVGHSAGHEFNLGDCQVTVLEVEASNVVRLSSWTPFLEDPDEFDPDVGDAVPVDRDTVAIMDKTFEVSSAYVAEDGGITIYTSVTGDGPAPIPGAPAFVDGCKPDPSTVHEANQTLALYRVFYDWDEEEDLFVGMIHPSMPTEFGGGIASANTDSVSMRMTDSFGGVETWYHSGAETLAHEAGHAAGLKHVPCKDDDGDGEPDELAGGAVDLSHPAALTFPNCTLAEVDPDGFYGFDVYWELWDLEEPTVISNNPNQARPNRSWPFMAYKNPGWADPYHYCRLLEFYGVPCDPTADLGIGWDPPNAGFGGGLVNPIDPTHSDPVIPLLIVTGFVDPTNGTYQLTPLTVDSDPSETLLDRFARQSSAPVHEGDPYVVVRGYDGSHRLTVGVDGQSPSHEEHARHEFSLVLPFGPDDASIELFLPDGESLATFERSDTAPTVTIREVRAGPEVDDQVLVSFEGSDADDDDLTYTVLYAPDGEHWQVVGSGLDETTLRLPTARGLPAGDAPAFRVIAFDGLLSGEDRADADMPADGNTPPLVWPIGDPTASYPLGELIRFEAVAFDLEDRTLPPESVAWSSSLDGDLGTGTELEVDDLSAGKHEITVTATDSHDAVTASRFSISIDGASGAGEVPAEVVAAVDDIFAGHADGADLAADVAPGPSDAGLPLLPIAVAVAGVAFLAVGGTIAYRRRAATRP